MKLRKQLKDFKLSLMQDTITFQRDFMLQWVTTMVNLDVFESTAIFGDEYSNALQYNIQKLYYDNFKQAKDIVNEKVSTADVINYTQIKAFEDLGKVAKEDTKRFLNEEKADRDKLGSDLLFKKYIPEHRP